MTSMHNGLVWIGIRMVLLAGSLGLAAAPGRAAEPPQKEMDRLRAAMTSAGLDSVQSNATVSHVHRPKKTTFADERLLVQITLREPKGEASREFEYYTKDMLGREKARNAKVEFLDLGNGNKALIELPSALWLPDGGGERDGEKGQRGVPKQIASTRVMGRFAIGDIAVLVDDSRYSAVQVEFADKAGRAAAKKKVAQEAYENVKNLTKKLAQALAGAPVVKELKIRFEGSFQYRLATAPDDTTDQPTDPYGIYGVKGNGWTFIYKEPKFDRVIRLSKPSQLRNGLIDAWQDTVVTTLEADSGQGLQSLKGDPLLGKDVSLGASVCFDEKAGGGALKETLPNFKFSLGGALLSADPDQTPQLDAGKAKSDENLFAEYTNKKPKLIQKLSLDPVRKQVLSDANWISTLAGFFRYEVPIKPVKLVKVQCQGASGVLQDLGDPANYSWEINIAFFRYDGDTLTGRVRGEVRATRIGVANKP